MGDNFTKIGDLVPEGFRENIASAAAANHTPGLGESQQTQPVGVGNITASVDSNGDKDLENRFSYHPPIGNQQANYLAVRAGHKQVAYLIKTLVPPGREQAVALTKLEESMMWANAGIARNPIS